EHSKSLKRQKRAWMLEDIYIVEEDKGPFPKVVEKLDLQLKLERKLEYKLTGQGADENPVGLFTIHPFDATIYVHRSINYEVDRKEFKLALEAYNRTTQKIDTRLRITIKVRDINDNSPEFDKTFYEYEVNEMTWKGSTIGLVHASDRDEKTSSNGMISYSIISQSPQLPKDLFTIERNGFISLTGCLNYEEASKYTLTVQAKDNGEKIQYSSSTTVQITIQDGNNNALSVAKTDYNVTVNERESSVTILKINVTDKDTPYTPAWRAKFKIVKGNEDGHYKIETDPNTNQGILTVVGELDFEGGPQKHLSLTAANEEKYLSCSMREKSTSEGLTTITVIVNVWDVNDPPEFSPRITQVSKRENLKIGTEIGRVTATDSDKFFPNAVKNRYKIAKDEAGWISVNEITGVITTKGVLDRESTHVINDTYTVLFYAIDNGEPLMTGTGTVVIHVIDENDNPPFLVNTYVNVTEDDSESYVNITAADFDIDINAGPFVFNVLQVKDNQKGNWELGKHYGNSVQLIKPKNVYSKEYSLVVKVSDRQGHYSHQNLTVRVCRFMDKSGSVCAKKS
uniref:Cadherin domain-containing protein n=1 Tax=Latimeria chalumnae TaxID=7897 RepID=H3B8L5_LATCH